MKIAEIPGSLAIVKLDDRHYQLTDISQPSIGLCLGIFPSDGAARSFAARIASIRALGSTQSRVVTTDGLQRVPLSASNHQSTGGPSHQQSGQQTGAVWKSIH